MTSSTSLLRMPDVAMGRILEKCDFESILVLRKVCHDLRSFIDDINPASRLTRIDVSVNMHSINFNLYFPRPYFWLRIDYTKNYGEGCLVRCNKDGNVKEKLMENEDFGTLFSKDFDIVLGHQKTVLEHFGIIFDSLNSTVKESVLESIHTSFKSMIHPLQIEYLNMEVNNNDEILIVIPFIVPKSLIRIDIYEASKRGNVLLNLDEIGQLEQWKQADEVSLNGFLVPYPSQNFKYFSSINFILREVSTEELILLKEIFLSSSILTSIEIVCYGYLSQDFMRQNLIESYGQPFVDSNLDSDWLFWFFAIPDTNQFFKITQRFNDLYFKRIEQSDLPQSANISN